MSKFYVGQRVRIKWSDTWPELNGLTGTIIGRCTRTYRVHSRAEWDVRPDGYQSNLLPDPLEPNGKAFFSPHSDQLEPATDCYDKTEWDACVWKPEHLRVGA